MKKNKLVITILLFIIILTVSILFILTSINNNKKIKDYFNNANIVDETENLTIPSVYLLVDNTPIEGVNLGIEFNKEYFEKKYKREGLSSWIMYKEEYEEFWNLFNFQKIIELKKDEIKYFKIYSTTNKNFTVEGVNSLSFNDNSLAASLSGGTKESIIFKENSDEKYIGLSTSMFGRKIIMYKINFEDTGDLYYVFGCDCKK